MTRTKKPHPDELFDQIKLANDTIIVSYERAWPDPDSNNDLVVVRVVKSENDVIMEAFGGELKGLFSPCVMSRGSLKWIKSFDDKTYFFANKKDILAELRAEQA